MIYKVQNVLVFDKNLAILATLAVGLCGLPLSFWLFREEKKAYFFDKLAFGYLLGIILLPSLFFLESLAGINFSQFLVVANWILILFAGILLLAKDGQLKLPSQLSAPRLYPTLTQFSIFAIMASVFLIGLSSAGGVIFELDPYYYIEGVKQVVMQGSNFQNDGSAWFPYVTSHLGTPIWKYQMASIYSLYGSTAYNPYVIAAVLGVQPAMVGALAVFLAYFLFKQMYNDRVGILVAGCLGFMPVMLIKFQGGNFQVEPFNILALLFFFSSIVAYFAKPEQKERQFLFLLSYATILLGSNLGSLTVFIFSITLFLHSFQASFLDPDNARKTRESGLRMIGLMFAVIVVNNVYWLIAAQGSIPSTALTIFKDIVIFAGAYALPMAIDFAFARLKVAGSSETIAFSKLAAILILTGSAVLVGSWFPLTSDLVRSYVTFGAYTAPLERTIAEQAPGSEIYSGQFGFLASGLSALPNSSGDLFVSVFSLLFQFLGLLNAIPNFFLNSIYAVFVWGMNTLAGANFELVQKGNSLMTLFLFLSIALLTARFVLAAFKKEEWPMRALLLLPFIFAVSLVAFGKQKLVLYLGIALAMAIGAFWGEAEAFISEYSLHKKKKEHGGKHASAGAEGVAHPVLPYLPAISWIFIFAIVMLQFGSPSLFDLGAYSGTPGALYSAFAPQYGLRAMPLLLSSLTPRIYDSPVSVLSSLQSYCQSVPADSVCNLVNDWNNTASTPSKYFSYDFCARSLWPYPNKQPPNDMGLVFSYRCSFVSTYWLDSMEWLNKNMADDDRLISWWDYGHWTNFFAQKKTVLRNEHAQLDMIGRTAYAYVHGNSKDLRDAMRAYGSRTALFDVEIIGGGTREQPSFGGKFGALNYLGCAWVNKTTVNMMPGQSSCEQNNMWEQVYVPLQPASQRPCVISESSQIAGIEGYVVSQGAEGQAQAAQYCLSEGIIGGQRRLMAYRLGSADENGDLKLQRALWNVVGNDGQTAVLQAVYNKDKIWPDASGQLTDGWADRTTNFYRSNLYSAFMNNELEGFDLVYSSPQIRIFKMKEEYYNSDR